MVNEYGTSPPHGSRTTYQRHACRCLLCKAANAAYGKAYYRLKAQGKQPLGALVDAKITWKQIKALRIEGFSYAEIARRLGLRWPVLQLHHDKITIRNWLKIRRLARGLLSEAAYGCEETNDNHFS